MEAAKTERQPEKHEHSKPVMLRRWDVRPRDQFRDIDIIVGEKVFRCHRNILSAGSEYFRAMFSGSFVESSAKEFTLHKVDENTFERILLFIYNRDANIINIFNACDLIHAACYFGITLLEEHLIEFAMKNVREFSSDVLLKMFTSAHTMGTKNVAFRFFGKFIYGNFGFYSDLPEFMNLTWDSLVAVAGLVSGANEPALSDTFMEGVFKWIRGRVDTSADERGSYLKEFVNILHQTKSFTTYAQLMLDQYTRAEQAPAMNAVAVLDERPQKLLRAFVTRLRAGEWIPSIFTLHEMDTDCEWAYSGAFNFYSGEFHLPIRHMKNVVIDDLYTLIPGEFDRSKTMFIRSQRAFSGAPHISMYQHLSLTPPPILGLNFEICGKDDHIFAIDKSFAWNASSDLMLYRRDIDKWFPIPTPRKYAFPCITCDEKMVYLIGGQHSHGAVQCYDLRAPAWMDLPPTAGIYENAACCIRDGKVWVMGGYTSPNSVEIFDPIARTWESGKNLIVSRRDDSRLIHWDSVHHGRTIISFTHDCDTDTDCKILFSSDRCRSGWKIIPGLYPLRQGSTLDLTHSDVVRDMIVF